ncbi:MAG: Fe-Mn family superoxide dismutase [Actinomycetota bacterium]|nr:Fe-Mn family superoxide dismutase [Actinomycetota bacterium]
MAIDAWEHAYYLQYENRKGEFFDATWNVVSWTDIGRSAPVPAAESATPS